MWSTAKVATSGVVLVFCLVLGIVQATIAADDSYMAGYAAAVLEHEFNVSGGGFKFQVQRVVDDAVAYRLPGASQSRDIFSGA
ncbi:MAG: hypothetical protein SGJ26_06615, partial [Nitrospirota bacterium]|nr:hypothetical protein [Nitrospirota bacterium]